jgi:2-polyprenyl-3-methyl-5-hydroxy-6-metoxy-1,4-benzoquinol methylase
MPMFTQSQLLDFWRGVVDPNGIGMPEAIAGEIASYTRETAEQVLLKMQRGTQDLKQLWTSQQIDVTDAGDVERFYRDQFVEAYELANWHCGRTNGTPPLNYAFAALLARHDGLFRVLDFGSGIGTGSIALASVGCEVHSADIADQLLDFVGHRMSTRGYEPRLVRLSRGQKPLPGYYDLITCFDVLEHVLDQRAKLAEIERYLRYGGILVVNLMYDSRHVDRPMHISSAGSPLKLVRQTGLKPDWREFCLDRQLLVRTRTARLSNRIARFVDHPAAGMTS